MSPLPSTAPLTSPLLSDIDMDQRPSHSPTLSRPVSPPLSHLGPTSSEPSSQSLSLCATPPPSLPLPPSQPSDTKTSHHQCLLPPEAFDNLLSTLRGIEEDRMNCQNALVGLRDIIFELRDLEEEEALAAQIAREQEEEEEVDIDFEADDEGDAGADADRRGRRGRSHDRHGNRNVVGGVYAADAIDVGDHSSADEEQLLEDKIDGEDFSKLLEVLDGSYERLYTNMWFLDDRLTRIEDDLRELSGGTAGISHDDGALVE